MALLHSNLLSGYVTASTHNPHAPTITTPAQGLQNRSVWSNRRPLVAVYRTGLTGNRWKPIEFKTKFKNACVTGSDRFTGPV